MTFLNRYKENVDVDFTLVKRGLYYIRNKSLADSPKTIADIVSAFDNSDVNTQRSTQKCCRFLSGATRKMHSHIVCLSRSTRSN